MSMRGLQTALYFAVFLTVGAIIASLGPTLPMLAENVGVGVAALGFAFTARSFGYLLGALGGGGLYDRLRGHRLLLGFLAAAFGALVLIPQATALAVLLALIFMVGLTQGGIDVGVNTLLIRVRADGPARYLNTMYFFAGMGSLLIPLYLSRVSLTWGYRGLGAALLPVMLGAALIPSPTVAGQRHAADAHLSDRRMFIALCILAFIIVGSEVSYGGWIFTFFTASALGTASAAYQLTALFWSSITLGRLLSIFFVARFEPRQVILADMIGAVLSAALLLVFHRQVWAIFAGSLGMGVSVAALFPTAYAYVQQYIRVSGKLAGVVWTLGSLGAMILPWGIGALMEATAPAAMMAVMLTIWLAALLIFLAALRPRPAA